jgi:hypothetical protein
MTLSIRPLLPDEPEFYREIRLEALRLHPEAFGASFEDESARPLVPSAFAPRSLFDGAWCGYRAAARETR